MTKLYTLLLAILCCFVTLDAQSVVVPANLTTAGGFSFTDIDSYIDADTTATGERAHDTYLLEAGGIYFFTKLNRWAYDVTLKATGDVETLGRPLIDRRDPSGGSNRVDFYRGSGNFTFDGLYLIYGDEGPNAASYETAAFRPEGIGKTYSWNNCIVEKSRQGLIRNEGNNCKIFVTNNIMRNFGDYGLQQGNGRIVDLRATFGDSVIIKNNVMHNLLDRLFIGFRQQGLNYFEFSKNTVFNHVGRHGFIQLRNTKESVINDNFFQNPSIIGSSAFLANEQINFRGVKNFLFSLDTIVEGGSVTMLNNNINYTDDVLNHYATFDSVTKPDYYSPVFLQAMTNDVADADFEEVLELAAVPSRQPLIQYAREAILYKDSVGITNIMVEDSLFAVGTDYDRGYLFDFDRFSPCYDPTSMSATAATDGGAVGATGFCADLVNSVRPLAYNPFLSLKATPNPASEEITFTYQLTQAGSVQLSVFDVRGALVTDLVAAEQPVGEQKVVFSQLGNLATGMYFASIRTPEGRMYVKFYKQ